MNTADRDNTDHETGHDTGQRLADPFAALAEAGIARGPRFDPPPPQTGSQDLEHVLQNVEDLSQGIETLLRTASTSAIGGPLNDPAHTQHTQPTAVVDRQVSEHGQDLSRAGDVPMSLARADHGDQEADHEDAAQEDDDEIMRVFDEDEPSDIHAIDRMLARQADEQAAQFSEPEVADEETSRRSEQGVSHTADNAEDSGVLAVIGEPVMANSSHTAPPVDSHAHEAIKESEAQQADMPAYSMNAIAAAPQTLEQRTADLPAGPGGVHADPAMTASSPRAKSAGMGAARAARGAMVEVLALVNLPLCVLPPSLRPTVNVLAVTLALWAPAVWWLAPRLAERAAAASSAAASEDPAHHQSALREESAAHGESGGGAHGGH